MRMLFKVDENLHADVALVLKQAGHDAMTVHDQNLTGSDDAHVIAVCKHEGRILLTLDVDFADVRIYPPQDYPGIIVIRLTSQTRANMLDCVTRLQVALATTTITGQLWIVDENRIRIRSVTSPG